MVASIRRAVHLPINPFRTKRGSSFSPLGFSPSGENSSPTKNILWEALYYQVFDRFEPPVNPPCSASRSTAVFHLSWCLPSWGRIVRAPKYILREAPFSQLFDNFEHPVDPHSSASRGSAYLVNHFLQHRT